jgi:hypothetical protein
MHASTSTAARTATAIAADESVSECFEVWGAGCPPTTTALTVVLGTAVVATGVVGVVLGVLAVPTGVVVAGAVALTVAVAAAEGFVVVVECTLSEAGIGKVDVGVVGAGI